MLEGERVPVSGRARGDQPDIKSKRWGWLSIEMKNREVVPAFLLDGIVQARAAAKPDQLPVVILHKVGSQYADSLVCIRFSDFTEWFGEA